MVFVVRMAPQLQHWAVETRERDGKLGQNTQNNAKERVKTAPCDSGQWTLRIHGVLLRLTFSPDPDCPADPAVRAIRHGEHLYKGSTNKHAKDRLEPSLAGRSRDKYNGN